MKVRRTVCGWTSLIILATGVAVGQESQHIHPPRNGTPVEKPNLFTKVGRSFKSSMQNVFSRREAAPSVSREPSSSQALCPSCQSKYHGHVDQAHQAAPSPYGFRVADSQTYDHASSHGRSGSQEVGASIVPADTQRLQNQISDASFYESRQRPDFVQPDLVQAAYGEPTQPRWQDFDASRPLVRRPTGSGTHGSDPSTGARQSLSDNSGPPQSPASMPRQDPRLGNGASRVAREMEVPTISGRHLNQGQMTATEHALLLNEKLKDLRAAYNSLTAYNEQLESQILEKSRLVVEMEKAVENATVELQRVVSENARMQQESKRLREEFATYKNQTSRLLDTIKTELDDALMRQIVSEGNP